MSARSAGELRIPAIPSLTGIRGIAAAWVLVEHFRFPIYALLPWTRSLDRWIDSGYLGVEVFFILSGFIISYNYANRMRSFKRQAYGTFLVNRFARIYPVHLFTLAAVAVLVIGASATDTRLSGDVSYTLLSFTGNVTLLQALPSVGPWNGPAWSISAEAFAYVCFPAVALLLGRMNSKRVVFWTATAWFLVGSTAMFTLSIDHPSPTGFAMIALRISTEFIGGCLIWKLWSQLRARTSVRWDAVALFSFLTCALALASLGSHEGKALVLAPLFAVFILACAGAAGPVSRVLTSPIMQWSGRVSYSVYMTHFIVLMVVGKLLPWNDYVDVHVTVRIGILIGYGVLCLLSGWLCYLLVEEPGRRAVRRITLRKEGKAGSAL